MTPYEIYVFILCFIIFVALTALFFGLIAAWLKATVKLIRAGAEDENIKKEYMVTQKKRDRFSWLSRIFSAVVCAVFFLCFIFSLFLAFTENDFTKSFSSLKIVKSSSMAQKYKDNRYLSQNGLDDQIQMFDLIVTEPLPAEEDLKLYDIVVYETENGLVIHRIVSIEEPNASHPDERYFRLRGDANKYSDSYPVYYSQMRAIYRGERIPFIGNFIMFLQAPAGWLCILLILFAQITTPIVEKKVQREIEERLKQMKVNGLIRPVDFSLKPIALSHFHLSFKLQKQEPKMCLHIDQKKSGLKITIHKGNKQK